MIVLALKLLIAHVLGDFVFQPNKWVAHKLQYKQASIYLYLHIGIHLLSLLILLQLQWTYWPAILIIIVSHYAIDLTKLHLNQKVNNRLLFVLDQIAHLLVISGVIFIFETVPFDWDSLYTTNSLTLILALLSITHVAAIIMRVIMSKWTIEENSTEESLPKAGKYIGILERLFIFCFIVLNHWSAIGYLIAAKSVFRFSDLTRAKDRKLTEYILIGTLLSFGMAIITGLAYTYIVK